MRQGLNKDKYVVYEHSIFFIDDAVCCVIITSGMQLQLLLVTAAFSLRAVRCFSAYISKPEMRSGREMRWGTAFCIEVTTVPSALISTTVTPVL